MYVNNTQAVAASKNYTGVFFDALLQNPMQEWFKLLFWIYPSTVLTEIFAFAAGLPMMREWVGPREIASLAEYSTTVTKKDWEATIGVGRDDVFFDRFNIITPQIQGLASMYPHHLLQYFIDGMLNAFSTLSFDGSNFFDTAHPNGPNGATFRNTTDQAFSASELELAQSRSAQIKNLATGRPLGIRYDWIFYAPNAEADIKNVLQADRLANGATNIHYNDIAPDHRVRVDLWGASRKWFMFDLSKALQYPFARPFVLQLVKSVDFVPFDRPDDWNVFSEKKFVYGIDSMDNAAYLLPHVAYGSSVA